jgi:hypothetical protein
MPGAGLVISGQIVWAKTNQANKEAKHLLGFFISTSILIEEMVRLI